jgi:hypothetical protein
VVCKWTNSPTIDCPDVCLEAFWPQELEWVLEDCHKRSCWKNSIGVSVPRPCRSDVYVCSKSCWLCLTVVYWFLECNKIPSRIEPRVRYKLEWAENLARNWCLRSADKWCIMLYISYCLLILKFTSKNDVTHSDLYSVYTMYISYFTLCCFLNCLGYVASGGRSEKQWVMVSVKAEFVTGDLKKKPCQDNLWAENQTQDLPITKQEY